MNEILQKGKKLLSQPQNSILSAASVIMLMIIASRILGLVRQRTLAHFFAPADLSLFFAAFRLPDLIFEVLVFGTFSSAFIPVFSRALKNGDHEAWEIAGRVVNIGLVACAVLTIGISIWAEQIYTVIAPGYTHEQTKVIANLARVLFIAQGFFVISYVLTGVLESLKRFVVPGLAPIFYNLGIIFGTYVFWSRFGLFAPVIGVIIGAAVHFLVQLPLAYKLGFRFIFRIRPTPGVMDIGKLAAPRLVDLSFQQIAETAELYFASLISTAAYTYFTFANSLQLVPLGLFGTSLAKAALPTLTQQEDSPDEFKNTVLKTLSQMYFLIVPAVAVFVVLRIPVVRLVFGTDSFNWESTVQTGMVLSAFALGVPFRAALTLLSRAFYALHDTKTPVIVSLVGDSIAIAGNIILVKILHFPVWSIAAGFSVGGFVETIVLVFILRKKLGNISLRTDFVPIIKSTISGFVSGLSMFFLLRIFDKYAWIKHLSFINIPEKLGYIPFERFVLDTRYTTNLLILFVLVSLAGGCVYLAMSVLLKSQELNILVRHIFGTPVTQKLGLVSPKESETITPPPSDSSPTS